VTRKKSRLKRIITLFPFQDVTHCVQYCGYLDLVELIANFPCVMATLRGSRDPAKLGRITTEVGEIGRMTTEKGRPTKGYQLIPQYYTRVYRVESHGESCHIAPVSGTVQVSAIPLEEYLKMFLCVLEISTFSLPTMMY